MYTEALHANMKKYEKMNNKVAYLQTAADYTGEMYTYSVQTIVHSPTLT